MTVLSLFLVLVVIPAVIGYCLYTEFLPENVSSSQGAWRRTLRNLFAGGLEPGDPLIYRKSKASQRPGPRARNVRAAEHGDDYFYEVDKFWALSDVLEDGRLVAVTRRGKHVYITREDERLKKAGLLARMRHRGRFPSV